MSSKTNKPPKPKKPKQKRMSLDDYCSDQQNQTVRDKRPSSTSFSAAASSSQSCPPQPPQSHQTRVIDQEVFVKNSRNRWQRTLVLIDWDKVTMASASPSAPNENEKETLDACDQLLADIIVMVCAHATTMMLSTALFEALSAVDRFALPWQQWHPSCTAAADTDTDKHAKHAMQHKELYNWSKAFAYMVQAFSDTIDSFAHRDHEHGSMDHKLIIVGHGADTAPVDRSVLQHCTVHYVRCTPNHSACERKDELLFLKQKLLGLIYDKHESLEYVAFGLRKWRRKKLTCTRPPPKHESHPSLESVTSLSSACSSRRSSQCSSEFEKKKKNRKRICENELFS